METNSPEAKMAALENMEGKNISREAKKTSAKKEIESPIEKIELKTIGQWHDLDISKLPHEGKYYKKGLRFQVQAPSLSTIKHFSAMDESNALVVMEAINALIKAHVRVFDGNKLLDPLSIIQAKDKMSFVLWINIYAGTNNALKAESVCAGEKIKPCNHKQEVKVIPSTLVHEIPSEKADGFFDDKKGAFVINTNSLGVHYYKPVTIEEDTELTVFSLKKYEEGDQLESQFLKMIGFLTYYKEEGETMESLYKKYMKLTSDIKILSLYEDILSKNIKLEQEPKLKTTCEKCGRLDDQRLTSMESLRTIFFVSNIAEEY